MRQRKDRLQVDAFRTDRWANAAPPVRFNAESVLFCSVKLAHMYFQWKRKGKSVQQAALMSVLCSKVQSWMLL